MLCFTKFLILLVSAMICCGCPCGKANRAEGSKKVKIVGGSLAPANAWPWTVALVYVGVAANQVRHFCGASIINNRYLLTAAHCVYDITEPLNNYRVFMGDNNINGTNVDKLRLSKISFHPQFNPKTLDNDVALIRLDVPLIFSDRIRPICLEQSGAVPNGRKAIVTGWGSVRSGGPTVNSQREVSVDIVNTNICRVGYATAAISITSNMLCAASNKKDSCTGDSGGPLFMKRKNAHIYDQIGLVSFGKGCALKHFPGVYTRVSKYQNWIDTNSADGQKC